ncbi:hypothetical protein N7528_007096 [Penicillium herquei]|nr:hypothetical protein N7528_007096 [Penicillium herquei]
MAGPSGEQPEKSNRQLKRGKKKGRKGRRKEEREQTRRRNFAHDLGVGSVKKQSVAGLTPRVKVVPPVTAFVGVLVEVALVAGVTWPRVPLTPPPEDADMGGAAETRGDEPNATDNGPGEPEEGAATEADAIEADATKADELGYLGHYPVMPRDGEA